MNNEKKETDESNNNDTVVSKIVELGYDKIAYRYLKERSKFHSELLENIISDIPSSSKVLDAGCGGGVPVLKYLASKTFSVYGIDISENMLKIAKENVPSAKLYKMDMRSLDFPSETFSLITSYYAIFHTPKQTHKVIFAEFYRVLQNNGKILISIGNDDWEGTEDFFGASMFWSQLGPDESIRLIKETGFTIEFAKPLEHGNETHFWIIAKK